MLGTETEIKEKIAYVITQIASVKIYLGEPEYNFLPHGKQQATHILEECIENLTKVIKEL